MKERKIDKKLISTICDNLEKESVELIDFDALKSLVIELQKAFERSEGISGELDYIKEEYRSRIIGMLKAVMACRQEEVDAQILVRLSDDIKDIKSEELVRLYSRVTARFRTSFPASFKYLTYPAKSYSQKNWSEHKI